MRRKNKCICVTVGLIVGLVVIAGIITAVLLTRKQETEKGPVTGKLLG